MSSDKEPFGNFFHLQENNTTVGKEALAGLTTFLAMVYILAVNPAILGAAGIPKGGVFFATALASFIGTALMAFMSNYPFALAPGMGLNAYFAFTVVLSMGYSWQFALLAVFVEGFVFLALSLTNVREALFNCIPMPLKTAVSVGIGLFIAYIALQGAHVIIANSATLTGFQSFNRGNIYNHGLCAILTFVGTLVTAWMIHKKILGSILWGILITWILGMISQAIGLYVVDPDINCFSLYPTMSLDSFTSSYKEFISVFCALFDSSAWTLTTRDAEGAVTIAASGKDLLFSFNFFVIMFAFMFVDIFDTLGTLIGVSTKAQMLDENGKLPRIRGALLSDSLATLIGAVLGTSTTTTFVESAAGVSVGGRTGLASIVTAMLFLASLIFAPIFLSIPAFATAPALIIVGFYMITGVVNIKFDDYLDSIPAYITILTMPLAYSISEGICLGVISWTILNFFSNRRKNIHPLMYVLTILFLAKYTQL